MEQIELRGEAAQAVFAALVTLDESFDGDTDVAPAADELAA
jgi:hypothetical protein